MICLFLLPFLLVAVILLLSVRCGAGRSDMTTNSDAKIGERPASTPPSSLLVLFAAFPFYWMLITTFKTDGDLYNLKSIPYWFNGRADAGAPAAICSSRRCSPAGS